MLKDLNSLPPFKCFQYKLNSWCKSVSDGSRTAVTSVNEPLSAATDESSVSGNRLDHHSQFIANTLRLLVGKCSPISELCFLSLFPQSILLSHDLIFPCPLHHSLHSQSESTLFFFIYISHRAIHLLHCNIQSLEHPKKNWHRCGNLKASLREQRAMMFSSCFSVDLPLGTAGCLC